jgi:hypothetical protein
MTLRVLDPRLSAEGEAARLAALVALLDNAKIGTERFYDHLEAMLRERYGVREVIRRRKPDASRPAPADVLGELSAADAIVSGIGD